MEQLSNKNPRIEVVDALRGFAVMAILLVHSLEHFIFPVYPTDSPTWLNILDQGVLSGVFTLFAGKSYAIFALLFGFTFYIQSNNQKKQGKDFGYRFLWRLVLLAAFATLNAAFFPAGDVLLLFVIVGLVLFFTRNWSDKAILITSIIFLLQPVEWYHYIAKSDQSRTSVTRSESRRNVRRSGRVHSGRQLLGFHLGERYFRSESQLIMGSKCRTFLPNSRIIPLRLLHRQKAAFRHDGKESPFLDKDTDNLRNLFCSSLCPERVDYAEQHNHTANSRNCIRYVAKVSFYFRTGSFIRIALPT